MSSDIRGNVDTVILKVLYEGDRYGYDMIKQINARSGGQWEIKQPTLYACLKRLEKQGFVKSYWDGSESNGGKRKYYSLTERGREVFITYKAEFERSRDLFGSLISDDEPILSVDDYSDVEEDAYQIPKRRPSRPRRPKADKPAPAEPAPEVSVSASEQAEEKPSEKAEQTAPADFVQQSFFDNSANTPHDEVAYESAEEQVIPNEQPAEPFYVEKYRELTRQEEAPLDKRVTEAQDPAKLLEQIYSQSYTQSDSFSGAQERAAYEFEPAPVKPAPPAPVVSSEIKPVEPPAPPAPAPEKAESALAPIREEEGESLARREYKEILGDLARRFEKRDTPRDETAAAMPEPAVRVRKFDEVVRAVTELGNEVTVRDHNDSAKEYNKKYFFYSNKLMMTHYTIMYSAMLLLGFVLFLTMYFGLDMRQKYGYLLYIFAGLFPIAMFIGAVIVFALDPDKRKRINVNFRASFIIRFVIMIQVAVVIYCINLIWGMPVSFSVDYLPSLVIPMAYAMFIPISEGIFMALLKSERYAAE